MKKTIITTVMLLVATVFFAQAAGTVAEKAKAKTAELTKSLSLSSEQQAKVEAIYVEFITAKEALQPLKESNSAEYATKLSAAKDKMAASLGKVLTSQQAKQFSASQSSK